MVLETRCRKAALLTKLPLPKKGKPEGILVLRETASDFTLLIFNDGARNGAPFEIAITKP